MTDKEFNDYMATELGRLHFQEYAYEQYPDHVSEDSFYEYLQKIMKKLIIAVSVGLITTLAYAQVSPTMPYPPVQPVQIVPCHYIGGTGIYTCK